MNNVTYAYRRSTLVDSIPVDDIIKMRNNGIPVLEIAKKFGVSKNTIYRVMPEDLHRRRAKITDEIRDGIIRSWKQGKSKTEIALMFSLSESAVVKTCRSAGIDIPATRRYWTTKEVKDLERYLKCGMGPAEIALKLGRTAGSVSGFVSEHYGKKATHSTPVDECLEKPNESTEEPEVIEVSAESKKPVLDITESHTKFIEATFGTYMYDVNADNITFDTALKPIHTKQDLADYIVELTAVLDNLG